MPSVRKASIGPKEFGRYHKELLTMFGIDHKDPTKSKSPQYGPGLRLAISVSKNDVEGNEVQQESLPTLESARRLSYVTLNHLAFHFGYMKWIEEDLKTLLLAYRGDIKPNTRKLLKAGFSISTVEFDRVYVEPIRTWLWAYGFYFHCVPASVQASDDGSKSLFTSAKEKPLCLLPRRPEILQVPQYHEADILRLAPAVLWVIKMRCSRHIICTREQLLQERNDWGKHFPTQSDLIWWEEIRQINPALVREDDINLLN